MDSSRQQQFIRSSLCWLLALIWGFAVIKILLPATLPFWLGLAVAFLLKPITLWLSRRLRFHRKGAAFAVMLLFYLLLGFLLWLLAAVLFQQGSDLVRSIPPFYDNSVRPLLHRGALMINGLLDDFSPQTARVLVEKSEEFGGSLSAAVTELSTATLTHAAAIAKKIPFWLTTIAFSVLCSVFISMDYGTVVQFLLKLLPAKLQPVLLRCKQHLCGTLLRMLKAYLILLLITFLQLFLGFFLLDIEQPLLWATVLALLDFLPFIGTGLILIPWGIFELLTGRGALGAGLLILFAILTLVHNLMEPKLVSSSIGLHPLATLLAMYAGLRFFGFSGLLLAPVAVLFLRFLQEEGLLKSFYG